jgi:iron complex transport system ATP-binding protein
MRGRRPSLPAPRPDAGARLEVVGLTAGYGRTRVLDAVRLTVEPGGWLAIIGPNGSGKSTLLRSVLGFHPHGGLVRVDGVATGGMPRRERARCLAYAPQTPVLPEGVTTSDYVGLGRTPHRPLLAAPRGVDRQVVADVMARLELDRLAERPLATLSGGEQQRAVLARALAQQPRVLLLDEPTAALDLGHAQQVLDLVDRLRRQDGLTVLSTLHDLTLAGQYADRLALLSQGRVVAEGTPAEVITSAALRMHYGARARIVDGPSGPAVLPVRAAD